MAAKKKMWTDERSEQTIGILLRSGVILAAAVVLIGGFLYLVHHGGTLANYRHFQGEPGDLRHVRGIVHDTFTWHSRGLIQLGLLLLIATPVARVAFSVLAFALERDWKYVAITMIVLVLLVYSLTGGHF